MVGSLPPVTTAVNVSGRKIEQDSLTLENNLKTFGFLAPTGAQGMLMSVCLSVRLC